MKVGMVTLAATIRASMLFEVAAGSQTVIYKYFMITTQCRVGNLGK